MTQTTTRKWSPYQEAIFAAVADQSSPSLIVRAVAGSGKTTTIVQALAGVAPSVSSIFLAFNKAIATELGSRGVNARTFHSLCYSPVTRATGIKAVDSNKLRTLMRDEKQFSQDDRNTYGTAACKLVGLARNDAIGATAEDTEQAWLNLAERHDVAPDSEEGSISRMITVARKLLEVSNASKSLLDFDDLLYRAVRDNIPLPKFDLILVDESQDTNAIQRAILRKIMAAGARIVAVGDAAQAIYGFRGADSGAMDLIAAEFGCVSLPLTVTYRCDKAIVKYASQWAPLEAAPSAGAGEVKDMSEEWSPKDFWADDLIVCRTNAPLVSLAYKLIRSRIPCHIMGREIGQGLVTLIQKLQAKGIENLREKLAEWAKRETMRAEAKGNDAMVAAIEDKVECIEVLISSLPENSRTVPELCRTIESLFSATTGVTLASIHKSKGLEASRVWWLNRSACPSKWAKQAWQKEQEANLCYVAATRAKHSLCLIEMPR